MRGYNLWMRFPTKRKAERAMYDLIARTHQKAYVRKFPNKREYGVYAH